MESIVFSYLSKDWEEIVSVWSREFYNNLIHKDAQQVISQIWISHSQEQRDAITSKTAEELIAMLTWILNSNILTEYPN